MNKSFRRMILAVVACLLLTNLAFTNEPRRASDASEDKQFETRCGWFDNPTPANISLYDGEDEWIIGVQGGYQVEGDWDWPDFKAGQWVSTNAGSHGYGCACLRLRVNRETHRALEIKSARPRPLAACRRDKSLKRWKQLFK